MSAYTKLLLHFDGADQSTTIIDSSPEVHTMTAVGSSELDTAQKVFGTASLLHTTTSDKVTTPTSTDWSFGTGNFTLDFRVRFAAIDKVQYFFSTYDGSDANNYWLLRVDADNQLELVWRVGGTLVAHYITTSALSVAVNTWYHIEVSRNGSTCLMFLNGTSQTVTENTAFGTLGDTENTLIIGGDADNQWPLGGWLDELRVSKGICRNTSNFTPPTEPYGEAAGFMTCNTGYWGA